MIKVRPCRKEYMRKWRAENPEYSRKHYASNRELYREYRLRKKADNPEAFKARARANVRRYYIRHTERVIARTKSWVARNPDKVKAKKNLERARKLSATIGCKIAIASIYKRCKELRRWFNVVVDHVMPLAKGGAHRADNLQIIYSFDNARKHSKLNYKPKVIFL